MIQCGCLVCQHGLMGGTQQCSPLAFAVILNPYCYNCQYSCYYRYSCLLDGKQVCRENSADPRIWKPTPATRRFFGAKVGVCSSKSNEDRGFDQDDSPTRSLKRSNAILLPAQLRSSASCGLGRTRTEGFSTMTIKNPHGILPKDAFHYPCTSYTG